MHGMVFPFGGVLLCDCFVVRPSLRNFPVSVRHSTTPTIPFQPPRSSCATARPLPYTSDAAYIAHPLALFSTCLDSISSSFPPSVPFQLVGLFSLFLLAPRTQLGTGNWKVRNREQEHEAELIHPLSTTADSLMEEMDGWKSVRDFYVLFERGGRVFRNNEHLRLRLLELSRAIPLARSLFCSTPRYYGVNDRV
jgi:hypothetical protein